MLDFETIYQKRGEQYIFDLLGVWERSNCIKHTSDMSLEERWAYFLHSTDHSAALAA